MIIIKAFHFTADFAHNVFLNDLGINEYKTTLLAIVH